MARFFRRGKTKVVFTQTVGVLTAPTVSNITTGSDLTAAINDLTGFEFANKPIDTPDLATSFTSKIPGPDEAKDASLKYYRDSASNPLDSTLAKDVLGFIIVGDYKILGSWTSGDKVDVWPVQVASNSKEYSLKNDPALSNVIFTVTGTPAFNTTIA